MAMALGAAALRSQAQADTGALALTPCRLSGVETRALCGVLGLITHEILTESEVRPLARAVASRRLAISIVCCCPAWA